MNDSPIITHFLDIPKYVLHVICKFSIKRTVFALSLLNKETNRKINEYIEKNMTINTKRYKSYGLETDDTTFDRLSSRTFLKLKTDNIDHFSKFPHLTHLSLSDKNVQIDDKLDYSKIINLTLRNLNFDIRIFPNLEYLHIDKYSEETINNIGALHGLKTLSISHLSFLGLDEIGLGFINNLKLLVKLHVTSASKVQIQELDLPNIAKITFGGRCEFNVNKIIAPKLKFINCANVSIQNLISPNLVQLVTSNTTCLENSYFPNLSLLRYCYVKNESTYKNIVNNYNNYPKLKILLLIFSYKMKHMIIRLSDFKLFLNVNIIEFKGDIDCIIPDNFPPNLQNIKYNTQVDIKNIKMLRNV